MMVQKCGEVDSFRDDNENAMTQRRNLNDETQSKHSTRYHLFRAGLTAVEIAEREGISTEEVGQSIEIGEKQEVHRLLRRFLGLRSKAAIDNEMLRKKVRKHFELKVLEALEKLLSSEDPEMLLAGIEQYRRVTGLVEKPAPASLTLVNIQTNTSRESQGSQ
ncbi:MAG: hypothetical protein ACRD2L_01165 [Terriglobia bacterium]